MPEQQPIEPIWPDSTYLRKVQYADDRNLAARQSIYAYSERQADLPAQVISSLSLSGNEAVIDVGCGNGLYLAELARRKHAGPVAGIDISLGMLRAASLRAPNPMLLSGDAARLPLRDAIFDATLAMHMLYHVGDAEAAVSELRRVTLAGGLVVIGLNGSDHLAELRSLVNEELEASGLHPGHLIGDRIQLDDAEEMLRSAFGSVTRHDLTGALRLPDSQPVADYVLSIGLGLRAADQERLASAVTRRLDSRADALLTVTTHCGWLICI